MNFAKLKRPKPKPPVGTRPVPPATPPATLAVRRLAMAWRHQLAA